MRWQRFVKLTRRRIAAGLRRLADKLDPAAPLLAAALTDRARQIVVNLEGVPHTSAWKRALAMKAMIAAFPGEPTRNLALAIELAVREVIPQ